MKKNFGYAGSILRINLSNRTVGTEPTHNYREWLGGSGVAWWINYTEIKPWMSPFDPLNTLVFGAGPLTGTLMPTSSRLTADAKSPLTLGVGSSNGGGYFASEMKYAGYDHIVLKGKANTPVYLWIDDQRVQLKDASHLWGRTTWETDDLIKEELGDAKIQVLAIGPSGENLVRGASIIINKNRALARCGLGAVMGSKNLKAIAVRGNGAVEVAEPQRFMEMVDKIRETYDRSPFTRLMRDSGTVFLTHPKYNHGGIPYKNFQDLNIPGDLLTELTPENIMGKYKAGNESCLACPIACAVKFYINSGPYAGLQTGKMEFEPIANFGGKLAVHDASFCIKANALCNQWGMDVDLPAQTIAWAMECYEKGLLTEDHFDGLKPAWGDAGVALELMRKIAWREGVGDILAEGVARADDIMGNDDTKYYAMNIKGQDLYEPLRFSIGWTLGACTSTRGGGHTTGAPVCEANAKVDPVKGKEKYKIDTFDKPLAWEGKEELVRLTEMLHRLSNCLGICHQGTDWTDISFVGFPELAELYSAAAGDEKSAAELQQIAVRILNVEKVFNIRHAGFRREDDLPPRRMMEEPVPSGPARGFYLDQDKFNALLDRYYASHGWDQQTGYPTAECLKGLGLHQLAEDLYSKDARRF